MIGSLGALAQRRFRLLWLGQAASEAGNALLPLALAFTVLRMTGSASDLGLVFAAALAPRVAFLLVGGVWADRLPRNVVMLTSDIVRALSQGLFALLYLTDRAELWHLLVAGVVYGTASAFFNPALSGLIPETLGSDHLQQGNALMGLTRNAFRVAGPIVAGIVFAAFGPGWLFAIDAGTFLVSACFLALLGVRGTAHAHERSSFLSDLAGGWQELTSRAWIWTSILYYSVANFALGSFWVLGALVAERQLGGSKNWGIILAGAGVGSIAGSAIALRLRPNRPLLAGNVMLSTIAILPALLVRPFPALVIAAAAAVGLAGLTVGNTLWLTALQAHVPQDALSRVSAYDWMGSYVFLPLGYALAGPLAAWFGLDATLWLMAGILALSSAAILSVSSVRELRSDTGQEPPPAAEAAGTVPPT